MPSLLDLGSQLHKYIASYLPVDDAKSLARTCSSLQDAGESAIWYKIDLDFDDDHFQDNMNIRRAIREITVRKEALYYYEQGDDELRGALEYLAPLLRRRPQRCAFVREIVVSCERISPFSDERFFPWRDACLAVLHPSYVPPADDGDDSDEEYWDRRVDPKQAVEAFRSCFPGLSKDETPIIPQPLLAKSFANFPILPAVRRLSLHINRTTCWDYTAAWSRIAPNVKALRIWPLSPGQYPTIQCLAENIQLPWRLWTTLSDIAIMTVSDYLADFTVAQLQASEKLRHFYISSYPGTPSYDDDTEERWKLAQAVAESTGLKRLDVPESFRRRILSIWRAENDVDDQRIENAIKMWEEDDEFYALAFGPGPDESPTPSESGRLSHPNEDAH